MTQEVTHDSAHDCYWCAEPIAPTDRVSPMTTPPAHYECGLRAIVGGINHLNGRCTCCGGTEPPDPQGMTKREAAKLAAKVWIERNPIR